MARYTDDYTNSIQNAELAASAVIIYCQETPDKQATQQFGSFNTLLFQNNSGTSDVKIRLNGTDAVTFIVPTKTAAVINPDHAKHFNTLEVTNLDAVNAIPADTIYVNYGIARRLRDNDGVN